MDSSDSEPRVAIVVVAYNAESTLLETLNRIPEDVRSTVHELFILDDASADRTHDLARTWAAANTGFETVVIRHSRNLGYGGNQKAAYRIASERSIDVVVLLHADGQYAPECLGEIIAPIVAGDADAVFGSRMMVKGAAKRGGMPLYKRLGNRLLTRFENAVLGTDLSEFHSGYRAYRVSMLDSLPVRENADGFHFDTQIIAQLVGTGARIVEVPIPTYYGDEICYVNGIKYAFEVVCDVVRFRLASIGLGSAPWIPAALEYDLKSAPASSHRIIAQALAGQPSGRVLDVGCSGGRLATLVAAHGHVVTGVDTVEVPGVRDRVHEFHRTDAARLSRVLKGRRFDYVLAGDVLEHLADPRATLMDLAELLEDGGQLLVSVPNFGHWYPRARVALGVFGYDRRGILDETHLRFFTRAALKRLMISAGFDVLEEWHTGNPTEKLVATGSATRVSPFPRLGRLLRALRPELFAYQNVLRCTPHAGSFSVSVYSPHGTAKETRAAERLVIRSA
jgi:glycosyltransferase involved in cell wall biosynthesis/SAM-dependent methyltransferase